MGTEPSTSISTPGSPTWHSPVLLPMLPAPSLPQADEMSQSPAESILRQLDYLPTGSILEQLDNVPDPPEVYASRQQSLDISAAQDSNIDGYEDRCAEIESQYPIDPLLEVQGSSPPESENQGSRNLAQDDYGISSEASRRQTGGHDDDNFSDAHIDAEYRPSTAESGESRLQEHGLASNAKNATEQSPRKRRKVSEASTTTKPQRCSSTTFHLPIGTKPSAQTEKHTSAHSMPSPPASHAIPEDGNARLSAAKFEEWPLQNVILKRVIVDDVATFQLQFEWPLYTMYSQGTITGNTRRHTTTGTTGGQARRASGTSARFTPEEDDLLIRLRKGQDKLSWAETHQRFNDTFPWRPLGSLQVHYSTKLKGREWP